MYTPSRILVTGGCGFIASHVVERIYHTLPNSFIINLDKLTYAACLDNIPQQIQKNTERYILVRGDICDGKLVANILTDYKIDTILHFAAETHVDNSFFDSVPFTQTNIVGTHTLLQAAHAASSHIQRFIHVSTDEVYGDTKYDVKSEKLTESALLCPTNPYAASKVGAEALVRAYNKSHKLPCIITRSNNVYGPRQHREKVIPKFITRTMRGQPLEIHGNGTAKRSFLYISDATDAFMCILTQGVVGTVYNIGVDNEVAILDLAHQLTRLLPGSGKIVHVEDRDFNDFRYYIDSSRLRGLGWDAQVSFDVGLKQTINWYLNQLKK